MTKTIDNRKPKAFMYETKTGKRLYQVCAPVNEEIFDIMLKLAREEGPSLAAHVRKAVEEYAARMTKPSKRIK